MTSNSNNESALAQRIVELDQQIIDMTTFSIRNNIHPPESLSMKEYLAAVSQRDHLQIKLDVLKTVNKLTDELG